MRKTLESRLVGLWKITSRKEQGMYTTMKFVEPPGESCIVSWQRLLSRNATKSRKIIARRRKASFNQAPALAATMESSRRVISSCKLLECRLLGASRSSPMAGKRGFESVNVLFLCLPICHTENQRRGSSRNRNDAGSDSCAWRTACTTATVAPPKEPVRAGATAGRCSFNMSKYVFR